MEPTLDLPTVAIAEQAHDSCFRIDALAARGHDAQGARAILASEHVVLDEPEAFRAKTIEPCRREREPADAHHLDPDARGMVAAVSPVFRGVATQSWSRWLRVPEIVYPTTACGW